MGDRQRGTARGRHLRAPRPGAGRRELVYSDAKAGRDVGEQRHRADRRHGHHRPRRRGRPRRRLRPVRAAGRDGPGGRAEDICRLLASGKNVVSTAVTALIYPASAGPAVVERLEAACAAGGTSFHGTGIEPGWGEVLPLTMSGILHRVDAIVVQEPDGLQHLRQHRDDVRHHGLQAAARRPGAPGRRRPGRHDLPGAADAAGRRPRRHDRAVRLPAEVAVALSLVTVAADHRGGDRVGAALRLLGRDRRLRGLTIEHITRMGAGQAPDWPTGRGWRVTVEGRPRWCSTPASW